MKLKQLQSLFLGVLLTLIVSNARGQFLEFSMPARASALGGNLVAVPEGSSALTYNPAGIALQNRWEASARYEDLFPGLENDSITTGNLSVLIPSGELGALGGAWDHLGSNQL